MRRLLLLIAMLAGVVSVATPAWAEPPTHVMNVTKNITQTVPPLLQCPAGTSVDLVFTESFHLIFTDTTFHFSDTLTGTFTTRGPNGEALSTGHVVATTHDEGPGFPTEAFTSVITAVGTTSDGSHNVVHILEHLTVTPAGEPVVAFERVDC
jgi:hypothetical protein